MQAEADACLPGARPRAWCRSLGRGPVVACLHLADLDPAVAAPWLEELMALTDKPDGLRAALPAAMLSELPPAGVCNPQGTGPTAVNVLGLDAQGRKILRRNVAALGDPVQNALVHAGGWRQAVRADASAALLDGLTRLASVDVRSLPPGPARDGAMRHLHAAQAGEALLPGAEPGVRREAWRHVSLAAGAAAARRMGRGSWVRARSVDVNGDGLSETLMETDRLAVGVLADHGHVLAGLCCRRTGFNLAGDLLKTIEHNDSDLGTESWNLLTRDRQSVATGLYLYSVTAPGLGQKIGKFAVINGQR